MEWILDNWYVILLGIIAVMFIFGRRPKSPHNENLHYHQHGTDDAKGSKKSGHGCCH